MFPIVISSSSYRQNVRVANYFSLQELRLLLGLLEEEYERESDDEEPLYGQAQHGAAVLSLGHRLLAKLKSEVVRMSINAQTYSLHTPLR